MDDKPTTESFMADPVAEDLAEKLQSWKRALEEEFKDVDAGDPESVRMAVRSTLLRHIEDFVDNLVSLATSASSESVQLNAIKYGIDLSIGKGAVLPEDDLAKLMKDLTK